jgi:FlaA1/EpsC-like NDP-sugar epimerase
MKRNPLITLFDFLSDTVNGGERAFLDFLSAIVPYGVPVIPAYLTFQHMQDMLAFNVYIAAVSAFVVEVLGMASMSTAIRFWRHNQKFKKTENRAPFWLALSTYVFYIVVVLVVNVLLEVEAARRTPEMIWAIALFSTLGVPSGVLVSIRAQHREMLEERHEAREARGQGQGKASETKPVERRVKHASDYKPKILALLDAAYARNQQVLTPKDITTKLGLPHDKAKGYVSTTISAWARDKGIDKKPPSNPMTF